MGMQYSPDKIRRINKRKKKTEARWASKSGEVVIRRVDDPKDELPPPKVSKYRNQLK